MLIVNSRFGKIVSLIAISLVAESSLPLGIATFTYGREKKELIRNIKLTAKDSRVLSAKEMSKMRGMLEQCPYVAGSAKWAQTYKGVDLDTGNFSMSVTDLTFEGGYGIPVNVTRSYSANNADEGPFGVGWTLSADVRSTAGGLLKSSGTPVMQVPLNMREAPKLEEDPNISTQPVEPVTNVDAAGKEETIQKDVDGVLSTPPWDKNQYDCQYETLTTPQGDVYQLMVSNTTKTPDGTVYTYAKKGYFLDGGTLPFNHDDLTPAPTPEPSNILKVTSATDRHGNITTYNYSTNFATFNKANGRVTEAELINVEMPNGHTITLVWSNIALSSTTSCRRIVEAKDGDGTDFRQVHYDYYDYTDPGNKAGYLKSVKTPEHKETKFDYGTPVGGSSLFITSITDPRGLSTYMHYVIDDANIAPYGASLSAVRCYRIMQPNGVETHYGLPHSGPSAPSDSFFYSPNTVQPVAFVDVLADRTVIQAVPLGIWTPPSGTWPTSLPAQAYQTLEMSLQGNSGISGCIESRKWFSPFSQDLLVQHTYTSARCQSGFGYRFPEQPVQEQPGATAQTVYSSFNFMGNPLSVRTLEYKHNGSSWSTPQESITSYAYWGVEKYFQQKAVKDPAERVSYTDYFDNQAAQGSKGQTKRIYSQAFSQFDNANVSNWKYFILPSNLDSYAARFEYDAKGRPINVWKLQKDTTSPWSYVQTSTTYGADNSPTWGAPISVTEDVGGIARTTKTNAYDPLGRAIEVETGIDPQHPTGKKFQTHYDLDGKVDSIYRVDSGSQMIVERVYGSSGIENGAVIQITDGLSGVIQNITYTQSGGGQGQPATTSETNGSDYYSCTYTYSEAGDRRTSTYTTPNGTTKWGYFDYMPVGPGTQSSRVFQTLNKLDANGNRTTEEFHYQYDPAGRLRQAAFAQTPQTDQTDYSLLADSRALAVYNYDAGGRLVDIAHYWETLINGSYNREAVLANSCTYNATKGLKTSSSFYAKDPNAPAQFLLERTETFGYDANRDYLTSASYNDGLANANPQWQYDAAGNRRNVGDPVTDWQYDNLNKATVLGGVACSNDVLGNRLTKGSSFYQWDALNRLTYIGPNANPIPPCSFYTYRADGMRVKKSYNTSSSARNTVFRYDGQMGMQDEEFYGSPEGYTQTISRYGLGARAIDFMEKVVTTGGMSGGGTTTTVAYPVYDGHGNMVATISKSGQNLYSVNNRRSFDAWGSVRLGSGTGDTTGRYCANLGHKQDDESGLIYMRARYYEPTSGRFISEDPSMEGSSWFAYSDNDPVNLVDVSGKKSGYQFRADFYQLLLTMLNVFYHPKDPMGLCIKQILSSALAAISLGKQLVALLACDSHYGSMAFGAVFLYAMCIGIALVLETLLCANALWQIQIAMEIYGGDEPDAYGHRPSEYAGASPIPNPPGN